MNRSVSVKSQVPREPNLERFWLIYRDNMVMSLFRIGPCLAVDRQTSNHGLSAQAVHLGTQDTSAPLKSELYLWNVFTPLP